MNLLFNFFDGSNEKIIWIQYKKKKYKRSINVRSINPLKLIKKGLKFREEQSVKISFLLFDSIKMFFCAVYTHT